jgi:hypothetical protein
MAEVTAERSRFEREEDLMKDHSEAENPSVSADDANSGRRNFLRGAALGVVGAMAAAPAMAQSAANPRQAGGETLEQLRQDMMAGIEDDVKKDLDLRAQANEELPRPPTLRPGAMLDSRFSVSYKDGVPEAMRLLTAYFAAMTDNDLPAMASTLHFPYATYEGPEPILYKDAQEFISNPPPSTRVSTSPDSQRRPGMYDIMDVLQLQTFNAINVGLELSYTRFRSDGYKVGTNQGIYSITNNNGKWGIQLSSVIFTPAEYIGQIYNDAIEANLRQMRTSMAAFSDRDYDILTAQTSFQGGPARKVATIGPASPTFFLSAWAGKPMEPYNSKGKMNRLVVRGFPSDAEINGMQGKPDEIQTYEQVIGKTNIVTAAGKPGWFFAMGGSGVGHYAYTYALDVTKVLHAGPEKSHVLSGYIRYTPDNIFISETRELHIMTYDLRKGAWSLNSMLGQSIRRDRSNDMSPQIGSV